MFARDKLMTMFRNREDAGRRLAKAFQGRKLHNPLVLAIPRGGVAVGAALAQGLDAELDIVLSRKLPAPDQPELAIGAISEDGQVHLNDYARELVEKLDEYLVSECRHQMSEISRRRKLFRQVRPQSRIAGRSVILTDDGIATGATMIAALQTVKSQKPEELIVAIPVSSADRLKEIDNLCDETICLLVPEEFMSVGQFYEDFSQVEDQEAIRLMREYCVPRLESAK
jgi:putative phosphoribosyl transferase